MITVKRLGVSKQKSCCHTRFFTENKRTDSMSYFLTAATWYCIQLLNYCVR